MSYPTQDAKRSKEEFTHISEILAVPSIGKPLPADRRWTLPLPDAKALADYQGKLEEVKGSSEQAQKPSGRS